MAKGKKTKPADDVAEVSRETTAETELLDDVEGGVESAAAPPTPAGPPPLARRQVALTLDLREGASPNYAQTQLEASLSGPQSQTLRRLADCCLADGARLTDGRAVDDCGTALRWLLERIAEADAGGPAAA